MSRAATVTRRQRTGKTRALPVQEEAEGTETPRLVVPVIPDRDHIQGPIEASLTLVEYGDYQCPYCGAAYPEVKKAQRELGSKVRFVFRNFPLTHVHEFAMNAAEAAEAAGAQGKFWEMHDFLYEHQSGLGNPNQALDYAKRLGLDTQRFEREIAQHAYQSRIKEDFNGGVRSGVNGTPTFYVNGVRHDGSAIAKEFVKALRPSR